ANPKVIAETVATPLEEAINGVEDMMYMKSVAGSDGVLQMTVTFRPGTDPDDAAVKVQNRVAQAQARLPEDVRRQGVTVQKQSDRKSTRLNSSHVKISYAVFCLKKKKSQVKPE